MSEAIYGYCPTCGKPGTSRARDMVGTTRCDNRHEWVPPMVRDDKAVKNLIDESLKAHARRQAEAETARVRSLLAVPATRADIYLLARIIGGEHHAQAIIRHWEKL